MSKRTDAASPDLERGTYEIIRDRLVGHGRALGEKAEALNARRLGLFGTSELAIVGSERIRTANNCVPRDIVEVGGLLLFGYNVFIGLKTETAVADVFSLYRFDRGESGLTFQEIAVDSPESFLSDPGFVKDFREIYQYYKETRILQLRHVDGKLLAVFQIGATIDDIKVLRWTVGADGSVAYVDNRGERDHVFPPSHDFVWTPATRDDFVAGRHPHVSIFDTVFVDTVAGDLTIKVENNTEDGLGIYREPVDERNQSLEDAQIHYARAGDVILLKILPYRETKWRHFVFNPRTKHVDRIDAIGLACVQLPEDHGIIFPGGYYLRSGETKTFDADTDGMLFMRAVRSPNGEDVLYAFHQREEGRTVLLPYNLIRKQVQTPIHCHGYSLFDDGTMVVFRAVDDEPTRVHLMQVWQTPFTSDLHAAQAPSTGSFLESIGNAELVRGISDALSLRRAIDDQRPTARGYEELIEAAGRAADTYHWLGREEAGDLLSTIGEIRATAELIVGEFEKVEALRAEAAEAVDSAARELDAARARSRTDDLTTLDALVASMAELRTHRGQIITLRDLKYVDRERLDALESANVELFDALGARTAELLLGADALKPYAEAIATLEARGRDVERVAEVAPIRDELESAGIGLDLLTEVVGNLKIDDATVRTKILEAISEVLGSLNRARAVVENRRRELLSREGIAEFGARFKLFSQNVASALELADTPEKCEAQLAKVMLQLEELESRFGEFDEFLSQLATKREEIYEAFNAKRQQLLDKRQRQAQSAAEAADRIFATIRRRASTFTADDELNAYFASDPMVGKVRELAERLRDLGDGVRADEVESKLKAARADASRALRDRADIFEEGSSVIKLGRHRFAVTTQAVELTMLPRDGRMALHISGTDYFEPIDDAGFEATREYWDQQIVSETPDVYRAEYLAASILDDAEHARAGLALAALRDAILDRARLVELVRAYATTRYDEGYERGVHDVDAAAILERLVSMRMTAGLLRYTPAARAAAALFWAICPDDGAKASWRRRARSLGRLRDAFAHTPAIERLGDELGEAIAALHEAHAIPLADGIARAAGSYLFEELAEESVRFVESAEALALREAFFKHLETTGSERLFADELREMEGELGNRVALATAWLEAFLAGNGSSGDERRAAIPEVVALLATEGKIDRETTRALVAVEIDGLLGQHPRIVDGKLRFRLDESLARLDAFRRARVAGYREYQRLRHDLLARERARLRLEEFAPKVMSSFVRNKLINEVYLPLIGDNLAKQIGALGESKRTDLMGMLLLVSPPGYGKTTLMEYVANRLGLVFVKVNGPSLGHAVRSLDPAEAPNATSRQEVEKINLALELGNNVLLYLDDIQHTSPELLQKFISLCDAQRKIEGVWRGRTRTYDMRGKRFCVCMAGNPYTESGEKFQIPDMLANRADTYNLGEILEGRDELFALSYIENALTSNPTLAPLTARDLGDVYQLVRMARGEEVQADQLAYSYSAVELGDVKAVLAKLLEVQKTLLKVNQQYILSASQSDDYRTEPPFKLQGSYRNMNKLAEKVVPVMNAAELQALVDDHYQGEAQTLTSGAEQNLLKLAELRGRMTDEQRRRWEEIKRGFVRIQTMGGKDDDPVARVTGVIAGVSDKLDNVSGAILTAFREAAESGDGAPALDLEPYLGRLDRVIEELARERSNGNGSRDANGDVVALLAKRIGELAARFDRYGIAVANLASKHTAVAAHGSAGSGEIAPYIAKLDETIASLAVAPRGGEVVQVLPSGVHDLIVDMAAAIENALVPAVRMLGQRASADGDQRLSTSLDQTLKGLDRLRDLLSALEKIDTRSLRKPRGRTK